MTETIRRKDRACSALAAVFAGVFLTCCRTAGVETLRLTSEPTGASVYIPRLRLQGKTPYEVRGLQADDRVVIRKPGYTEWTGRVDSLPSAGRGTYKLELQPIR